MELQLNDADAALRRRSQGRAQDSRSTKPFCGTVLTVDDDPDAITLLRLLLRREGFEVLPASSGAEALACIHERMPDLVITDVSMPGMTGLDLCRHLRDSSETRHIPIVVHSGEPLPPSDALYDCAFMKPANLKSVLRTVYRLTRINSVAARSR
jgi:CheY-like chemotaxis protein